jgi:hypothetical protein
VLNVGRVSCILVEKSQESALKRDVLFILIMICCSAFPLAAQHTRVAGKVLGGQHQTPLDNANVFLADTRFGTSTGSDGTFQIDNIPAGSYTLVVSRVGYQPQTRQVYLSDGDSLFQSFLLEERYLKTAEVQATATTPVEWKRLLKLFVREFIGSTPNASETRLLNPEVLNLHRDSFSHSLIATSDSIIRIENSALGYRIGLLLPIFTWNTDDEVGQYVVLPRFEPMDQELPAMKEMWKRNRLRSYCGSLPHFLKSLVHGTLEREGFTVHIGNLKALRDGLYHPWTSDDFSVSQLTGTTLSRLTFEGWLRIEYRGIRRRTSYITLKEKSAVLDEHGCLNTPLGLEILGDWADDRIAEMLPRDLIE